MAHLITAARHLSCTYCQTGKCEGNRTSVSSTQQFEGKRAMFWAYYIRTMILTTFSDLLSCCVLNPTNTFHLPPIPGWQENTCCTFINYFYMPTGDGNLPALKRRSPRQQPIVIQCGSALMEQRESHHRGAKQPGSPILRGSAWRPKVLS